MHTHSSVHIENGGLFSRVAHELCHAVDSLSGPALSRRQLLDRAQAEARNEKYGFGVF